MMICVILPVSGSGVVWTGLNSALLVPDTPDTLDRMVLGGGQCGHWRRYYSRYPPGHHVVRAELVRARLRRARRVGGPGGGAVRPGLGAGLARRAAQTGRSVQILLENI